MATYRARIIATAQGQKVHNVLHVAAGSAPAAGVAEDLADAWRKNMLPLLHTSYSFEGVELEDIATDEAAAYSIGTTGPTAGTVTGTSLPTFVCISVRLKTDRRGRAGAGRLGLSPVVEAITDTNSGNIVAPGTLTLTNNALNAFRTDLESSGGESAMTLVVVSYYKGVDAQGKPIKRPSPLVSFVTGMSANSTLGTRLSRHPNR